MVMTVGAGTSCALIISIPTPFTVPRLAPPCLTWSLATSSSPSCPFLNNGYPVKMEKIGWQPFTN